MPYLQLTSFLINLNQFIKNNKLYQYFNKVVHLHESPLIPATTTNIIPNFTSPLQSDTDFKLYIATSNYCELIKRLFS